MEAATSLYYDTDELQNKTVEYTCCANSQVFATQQKHFGYF